MQPNPTTRERVAVVMGGNSAEREISIRSGSEVVRALHSLGIDVQSLDYDDRFVDALRQLKPDVVFIALHGPGERTVTFKRSSNISRFLTPAADSKRRPCRWTST